MPDPFDKVSSVLGQGQQGRPAPQPMPKGIPPGSSVTRRGGYPVPNAFGGNVLSPLNYGWLTPTGEFMKDPTAIRQWNEQERSGRAQFPPIGTPDSPLPQLRPQTGEPPLAGQQENPLVAALRRMMQGEGP